MQSMHEFRQGHPHGCEQQQQPRRGRPGASWLGFSHNRIFTTLQSALAPAAKFDRRSGYNGVKTMILLPLLLLLMMVMRTMLLLLTPPLLLLLMVVPPLPLIVLVPPLPLNDIGAKRVKQVPQSQATHSISTAPRCCC